LSTGVLVTAGALVVDEGAGVATATTGFAAVLAGWTA
jgi:hypothetical protein